MVIIGECQKKITNYFFIGYADCPDVVLYRSLSNQKILGSAGYDKKTKTKSNQDKNGKTYAKKTNKKTNYESDLRLECRRDRSFDRSALADGPARESRFRSRGNMSDSCESGRRASREREPMAAVSGSRRRAKDGRS